MERLQFVTSLLFFASAVAGVYLLATDGSLWLLAVSHAVGLVVIVCVDIVLGVLNLFSVKRVYLVNLAAGLLGVLLQVGDIVTAPQYNMTIPYFASYLFHLGAYDALLALQAAIALVAVLGRGYARYLSRVRTRDGREMDYSKRGFFKAMVVLAGVVGLGVVAGSVKLPGPSQSQTQSLSQTSQSSLPSGAIANTKDLNVGSPVNFEYPAGYPNILLKRSDGTMVALSLLCTHVCCQCYYDSTNDVIFCPCHGSVFNTSGAVLRGPAGTPLPEIVLTVDGSGYVYPKSINGSSPCVH